MANSQESNSTLQGSLQTDAVAPSPPRTDRITRWLLIAIGIYSALLVSFLNLIILNSDKVKDRAIFLMADGMILLWIIVGGSLTPMLRRRLVPTVAAIPIDWRVRFVLFCTAMALTGGSHYDHDDQPGSAVRHDARRGAHTPNPLVPSVENTGHGNRGKAKHHHSACENLWKVGEQRGSD